MRKNRPIIILYIFALGSLVLTISLFVEGRNYPGTGWAIITSVFLFFIILERYLRAREERQQKLREYDKKVLYQSDEKSLKDADS
jgi:multisubunit Na+/H+ antiporter MnhB subunit